MRINNKKSTLTIVFVLSIIILVFILIEIKPIYAVSADTQSAIWDGKIATAFAGGNGSESSPYQINNGAQLAFLAQQINAGNYNYNSNNNYYTLINDIYLNDITNWTNWNVNASNLKSWIPIGKDEMPFKANFDGGGYAVKGIYINTSLEFQGLFGVVYGAVIRNTGIEDCFIKGGGYEARGNNYVGGHVGSIAGIARNSNIINCYNTGTVIGGSGLVGGITGGTYGCKVVNCYNTGTIKGSQQHIGGIAGTIIESDVINSYNIGQITGNSFGIGGITGYAYINTNIVNCYNTGKITGGWVFGGITGEAYGCSISNCYYLSSTAPSGSGYRSYLYDTVRFDDRENLEIAYKGNTKLLDALNAWVIDEADENYSDWAGTPYPRLIFRNKGTGVIFLDGWIYGSANGPSVIGAKGGMSIPEYEYQIDRNGAWTNIKPTNAGTYKVRATYKYNTYFYSYTTNEISFTISPKSLTNELNDTSDTFIYDGNPHTPTVVVSGLALGTDYIISYSDIVNAGTASVTITGIGNYSGTLSKQFIINKATYDIKATFTDSTFISSLFNQEHFNITIDGTLPLGVTVKYYVNGKEFNGTTKLGTYQVTAKFTGSDNYNELADMTATLTIKLSGRAIAIITAASVVVLLTVSFLIYWFVIKKKSVISKTSN